MALITSDCVSLQHFADIESALGIGWKVRLQYDHPYKALHRKLDGPVGATIEVKQGGYGPVKEEAAGGEKPKAKTKAEKAAEKEAATAVGESSVILLLTCSLVSYRSTY